MSYLEHPFAQYVRILGRGKRSGRSLTEEEAYAAMKMILQGEVKDAQIGAFLLLIRVREETAGELAGFVRAAKEHTRNTLPHLTAQLDWPSYAGKHKQLNWYILAALALSDEGVSVFMHGSNEHTPERLYSDSVLSKLGIPVCVTAESAKSELKKYHFAYMELKNFCSPLHQLIALRPILGVRSPIHTVSRLLNPSCAPYLLTSIFHPAYRDPHQDAAQLLGYANMAVFKGEGGEVERKPDARCIVQSVQNGSKLEENWEPLLPEKSVNETDFKISKLRETWRGTVTSDYGESAIISTLAVVHKLMKSSLSQQESVELARNTWKNRNRERL